MRQVRMLEGTPQTMTDKPQDFEFELDSQLFPLRPAELCVVLVVDDDPSMLEITSLFLEKENYQVVTAEGGEQALRYVEEHQPDVIISDVMMPDLDGIQLCYRIKSDPATAMLPVILVTAKRDTITRINGKKAGADDFLDKPVNELELGTRVRTLIRMRQLYQQIEEANEQLETRITERTLELRKAYDQLKELDDLKTNIISNVSHELRTPMQHIKSAVSLLTTNSISEDQNTMVRETVNLAIEALVRLVEDIINVSEGAVLKIDRAILPDVLRDAVTQVQVARKIRAEDIKLLVNPSMPPVYADARALTRAVYHLVDNACKFSDPGKPIRVVADRADNGKLRVTIEDKGIGISDEQQEHIFSMFYQGDSSSTRSYEGVGLGLALVKLVLDGHSVPVHFETSSKGTTFWFDMPVASLKD